MVYAVLNKHRMKLIFLFSATIILSISASAQQRPYYTQYVLNNFILNPAVAGIENYWDVKVSHRHQWVGLDGAPVTTYLTIQGPLKKNTSARETATTVHPTGENPRGKAYWLNYEATDPHHGIGFTVINDKTGPLNRFSAFASYAYHLPIGERTSLGAGISAGIQTMRLNTTELNFGTQYPVDPAVAGSGYLNIVKPDISAGLWLYSVNYFMGLSAQQIIPEKIGFNNGKLGGDSITVIHGKLIPHLFFEAGYKLLLSDDISLLPSITIKYINPVPLSVDINAKMQFRDIVWLGGSVRPNDGFAVMMGLNINSTINIGYSYDFTTSRLNTVSKGTHELLVGFLLGNKNDDWCPRNLW